jgi:membrane-bound lytic murein transglycosylase D
VPRGRSLKIVTTDRIAYKMKKKPAPKPELAVTPEKAIVEKDGKKEVSSDVAENEPQYYTVEPGDNLSAVARKYGVTVKDIKQWNNFEDDDLLTGTKIIVSKAAETVAEVVKPEFKNIEYTVKKGDFLSIIAKKNDVTSDQIKEWNDMDSNVIRVGQKLIVGKIDTSVATAEKTKNDKVAARARLQEEHYLVQKGDSLFSIAKKYPGITVSDIKKWNGIKGESIQPGMKLKING